MPSSAIDTLLRLVPDSPQNVLTHLQTNPEFASAADYSGYSLLHAAASYNQLPLLRTLVQTYNVDVNILDGEGESPLFVAETLAAARCLVEELHADLTIQNEEGTTAEDNALSNMEDGAEWPQVADYLERMRTQEHARSAGVPATMNGDIGESSLLESNGVINGEGSALHAPPPLPPNVRINMGTMQETPLEGENAPDPEFRRRIEELAAREDFQDEAGQQELRRLVEEAIGGLGASNNDRDVRRRIE